MKAKEITFIIILLIFTFSCSLTKKLEKQLIGKYTVETLKSDKENNPTDAYENLFTDLLKGSYIRFNKDKTYELSLANKITKGNWFFSDDGKTILTDKADIKFRINKFTETGLELYSFNKNDAVLMVLKKLP